MSGEISQADVDKATDDMRALANNMLNAWGPLYVNALIAEGPRDVRVSLKYLVRITKREAEYEPFEDEEVV